MIYMKDILKQYSLPCIFRFHKVLPSKDEWKNQVKRASHVKITKDFEEEVISKSSLKYLNPSFKPKVCHQSVALRKKNQKRKRANIKSSSVDRYLYSPIIATDIGTYYIGYCQMCNSSKEDTIHFLVECPYLYESRNIYIKKINTLIQLIYPYILFALTG